MPRQRLGVALLIPPPVAAEIDALRRAVGDEDVTRIAPHVTLVPPVNVREEEVDDAVAVLRRAAAAVPPLRLELGPVTTFAPVSPTLHLAVGGDVDGVRRLRDGHFRSPRRRSTLLAISARLWSTSSANPSGISALSTQRCVSPPGSDDFSSIT